MASASLPNVVPAVRIKEVPANPVPVLQGSMLIPLCCRSWILIGKVSLNVQFKRKMRFVHSREHEAAMFDADNVSHGCVDGLQIGRDHLHGQLHGVCADGLSHDG